MSDTVRCLYDFPFAQGSGGTVGADTLYPIATDILTANKWFCRYKTWSISSAFAWTAGGPSSTPDTFASITGPTGYTSELDIQRNPLHNFLINAASGGLPLSFAMFNGDSPANPADPTPVLSMISVGATYYPRMFMNNPGAPPPTLSFLSADVAGMDHTATCNLIIDGASGTLCVGWNDLNFVSVTPADITLAPASYWPYAAQKDGTPIYDTGSGATLQDPTN